METYKLRVKIGNHEFEAEGPSEVVKEQFEEFRALIKEALSIPTEEIPKKEEAREKEKLPENGKAQIDQLDKVVRYDPKTSGISLTALPQGDNREADSVLLLLLGHKKFKGEDEVLVTALMESLRQSGCPVNRLDRVMNTYTDENLVLKAGQAKGGKYRLTNQGLVKARAIAERLIALVP